MSLRLLEILVPDAVRDDVTDLLEDVEVIDTWQQPILDERMLVHVLVEAVAAEDVFDRMETKFAHLAAFRALIVQVVATIPRPPPPEKEPEPEPEPEAKPEPKKRSRVARDELLAALEPGTRITPVFLATVVLSTIVAGIGLLRDNVAVLVGAMVIAPLLTPNIALALATTLGDLDLGRRAIRTNLVGMALALAIAVGVGAVMTFAPGAEIVARTQPWTGDTLLALASGAAGALAFTSGVSEALVGVMVAVALLPPLVVAGASAGAGRWDHAAGAFVLLATNVICVNLAAVITFLVQGVEPRTWWEADKAKRATRRALLLWGALLVTLILLLALVRL